MTGIVVSFMVFIAIFYVSLQFIAGAQKMKVLLGDLQIEAATATSAATLSVGFVIATALAVFSVPPVSYLLAPVPLVVLLCVPALFILRKLRRQLECSGTDRAKPAMDWADKGQMAGWAAIGTCIVCWVFSIAPFFLGSMTSR